MTPFDDFIHLINNSLLSEEPTIEDFILLVGSLVAFVAFILWFCFPVQPGDTNLGGQSSCKAGQMHGGSSSSHYGKNTTSTMYNYGLKSGHTYHSCT